MRIPFCRIGEDLGWFGKRPRIWIRPMTPNARLGSGNNGLAGTYPNLQVWREPVTQDRKSLAINDAGLATAGRRTHLGVAP